MIHLTLRQTSFPATQCACSTYTSCVSNGVDVSPKCGCQDFNNDGRPYCYVAETCSGAQDTLPRGTQTIDCTMPPSPPPHPQACKDPLFPDQWHHLPLRSRSVWEITRGEESTVVVVDDGIQYSHPDLVVDRERSFGWTQSYPLVPDTTADNERAEHGTSVAGVAVARRDNGRGGCGVAPDARLVGVRVLNYDNSGLSVSVPSHVFITMLDKLFYYEQSVLTNSWGPLEGTTTGPGIDPVYNGIDEAMRRFGTQGRGAKGGLMVFAAGNGGPEDNVNDDGFAAHPYSIAVGSVGEDGKRVPQSEFGACIDVVAPSSGGGRSVTTTALTGTGTGYDVQRNHTNGFGGTSAAAPMVSAAIALMLSVNSELRFRDVRRILHTSTVQNHVEDDSWVENHEGRTFSPWYGFGILDVYAAVETAREWSLLPTATERCSGGWTGSVPLSQEKTILYFGSVDSFAFVDAARVYVNMSHRHKLDVEMVLVSPLGTRSRLTHTVNTYVESPFVPHHYLTHAYLQEFSTRDGWHLEITDVSSRGRLLGSWICVGGDLFPSPPSSSFSHVIEVNTTLQRQTSLPDDFLRQLSDLIQNDVDEEDLTLVQYPYLSVDTQRKIGVRARTSLLNKDNVQFNLENGIGVLVQTLQSTPADAYQIPAPPPPPPSPNSLRIIVTRAVMWSTVGLLYGALSVTCCLVREAPPLPSSVLQRPPNRAVPKRV